jgi:hypothetical protein
VENQPFIGSGEMHGERVFGMCTEIGSKNQPFIGSVENDKKI